MPINDDFIINLKSACNIEDIVSRYVTLKRDGRNSKGLCLFHSEKTPSMVIYHDTQSFYCFGCGVGGDIISFIMKADNLDYIEAIKYLCSYARIDFPENFDSFDDTSNIKKTIYEINRESAYYFHKNLKLPVSYIARKYLHDRNIGDNIIIRYGIGYATGDWDGLIKYLKQKGYSINDILKSALISKSKSGKFYDTFRNRIIFPIIDLRGNVIGFGGRVLDDTKPKYLNSADTMVFKKSKNLFSMNFAKNDNSDKIIIVEGYMDVISVYQAGFHNVVATLGTALTSDQARLISRYTKKEVIIAYDSDDAGKKATNRAFNLLREVGIKVKVLSLENAKDPDEYIRKFGAKRFDKLINNSNDIIDYELVNIKSKYDISNSEDKILYIKECVNLFSKTKRFDKLINNSNDIIDYELVNIKSKYDISNSEDKILYIKECVNLFSKIENVIDREVYILKLSNETGISKEVININVENSIKRANKYIRKKLWNTIQNQRFNSDIHMSNGIYQKDKITKSEEGIIYFIINNPDCIDDVLSIINQDHFKTEVNKKIFSYIIDKIKNNSALDFSLFTRDLSDTEISVISGIDASFRDILNSKQQLYDYLYTLVNSNNKIEEKDILNMTPEQIKAFYDKKTY